MGSKYKSAVLEDQTRHMIKQWHEEVKQKRKKQSRTPPDSPISNITIQLRSKGSVQHHPTPESTSRVLGGTSEIVKEIQEA